MIEYAKVLADSLDSEETERAVRTAYRRTLSRFPSQMEMRVATEFVEAQAASYQAKNARSLALADFCQTLFGLNEFVYLP